MFRRPKKPIRPRVVTMEEEEDEEDRNEMDSHELPTKKSEETKKSTLLSFEEELEEEAVEVFKVKKSSVSRRLMKEKRLKEKETKSSSKDPINSSSQLINQTSNSSQFLSNEAKDEGIENFIRILNGREAEACDLESGSEDDEEDNLHKYRAKSDPVSEVLRRTLEQEKIPDANLIHEIRKKRQMARDTGSGGNAPNFIPLDDAVRYKDEKSRLVREDDENDKSDDDDGEERVDFSVDSSKKDREKRREAFENAQDEAQDLSNSDSEAEHEEWEKQQISKAISQSQMNLASQQQQEYASLSSEAVKLKRNGDFNRNNSYSAYDSPKERQAKSSHLLMDDIISGKTVTSIPAIVRKLNDRLDNLKLGHDRSVGELSRVTTELQLLDNEVEESEKSKEELRRKLVLYQGIHCYVTDLIDCLRTKIPSIDELQKKYLSLIEKHGTILVERRRQDVMDECKEVQFGAHNSENETEAQRRSAEREGRRRRRKKEREIGKESKDSKNNGGFLGHREGMSTDDEEGESESRKFNEQKDLVHVSAGHIFGDVVDEFSSIDSILAQFLKWKIGDIFSYKESYTPLCIPKIISPLVRLHILSWDPIMQDKNIIKAKWMSPLLIYGYEVGETKEILESDPDLRLVPSVIEKICIPWVERLITAEYDPISSKQTKRLVHNLTKLLSEYNVNVHSKQVHSLFKSIITKLNGAVGNDVYIPMVYPNQANSGKNSKLNAFASRQFYKTLKLFENICAWNGVLSDELLQNLALDTLLNRDLMLSIRMATDLSQTVARMKAVVEALPKVWLKCPKGDTSSRPNGIEQLVRTIILIIQQNLDISLSSNKIHIREIAQVLKSIGATTEAEMVLNKYS